MVYLWFFPWFCRWDHHIHLLASATLRFGFAQACEAQAGAERQAEVPSSGTLQVTHWSTDVNLGIWWILMVFVSLFGKWLMMVDLIISYNHFRASYWNVYVYIIIHMYICNCSYLSILMFTFCPRGECRSDDRSTHMRRRSIMCKGKHSKRCEGALGSNGLEMLLIFVIHRIVYNPYISIRKHDKSWQTMIFIPTRHPSPCRSLWWLVQRPQLAPQMGFSNLGPTDFDQKWSIICPKIIHMAMAHDYCCHHIFFTYCNHCYNML